MSVWYMQWQKSWENVKKKTENFPQFSQNENIFVKMGEWFQFQFEIIGKISVFFSKKSDDFCQCVCVCVCLCAYELVHLCVWKRVCLCAKATFTLAYLTWLALADVAD